MKEKDVIKNMNFISNIGSKVSTMNMMLYSIYLVVLSLFTKEENND